MLASDQVAHIHIPLSLQIVLFAEVHGECARLICRRALDQVRAHFFIDINIDEDRLHSAPRVLYIF